MKRKVRRYRSDEITVEFDPRRCIHSGECVRGLPEVFDRERVPWIDPMRAEADAIARVVERCPTGALHYRRAEAGTAERPDPENVARVSADGPVYVRGRIRIQLPDGDVMEETRLALCRCGGSRDKPFCDGSHEDVSFRDPGAIQGGRLVPLDELLSRSEKSGATAETLAEMAAEQAVTFACAPNGPILVRGPLRVKGTNGATSEGHKGALCRCGHSATKPFCDGSHRDSGFEAD